MRRIYTNPPIIEALCEFRFEPSQPWDWTIPGLFYDRVKDNFPVKQQQNVLEVELRAEQASVEQRVKGGVAKMRFLSEDEKSLVQVGPDLLAINRLKPYLNWQQFRDLIFDNLEVYRTIAQPKGIRRIGLRYINKIEIPQQEVEINEYLLVVPNLPDTLPQTFNNFISRVEVPFPQAQGIMVLQTGSVEADQEDHVAFILDLDFISTFPGPVPFDGVPDWVERAHDEIEQAFEACITDKARSLFGEVKNHG